MKVKELIEELKKYDPELQVQSSGADCGGYDVIFTLDIAVHTAEHIERTYSNDYNEPPIETRTPVLYVGGKDEELYEESKA